MPMFVAPRSLLFRQLESSVRECEPMPVLQAGWRGLRTGIQRRAAGQSREPEAGAAADPDHGAAGHLPSASHQPAGAGTRVYSHLLRNAQITRTNQVWAADFTSCPWPGDFSHHGLPQPERGGMATVQHPPIGVGGRLWRRTSASTPCRRRWVRACRRCLTPTKAASSPAGSSSRGFRNTGWKIGIDGKAR